MTQLTKKEMFILYAIICIVICINRISNLRKYEMGLYHNKYLKSDMQVKISCAIQNRYLKSHMQVRLACAIWDRIYFPWVSNWILGIILWDPFTMFLIIIEIDLIYWLIQNWIGPGINDSFSDQENFFLLEILENKHSQI